MSGARIAAASAAHPPFRVSQAEAAARIGALTGRPREAAAIARGSQIAGRATVLCPEDVTELGTIEARNTLYRRLAPPLALRAAEDALAGGNREAVGCLVTSSCTGYSLPGWGGGLIPELDIGLDTACVPLTESGCAGGVVGLARAADYVQARDGRSALVVSAELCSLAFHAEPEEGNLTSALIFGDGAGAALIEPGAGPGLAVVESASWLIPESRHLLGFDLADRGLVPVLRRELIDALVPATARAVGGLLARNGVCASEVGAWLIHPGGSRILTALERALGLHAEAQTAWSWASLREFGNTSSAAIFDVLRRYLATERPPEYAVVAGFGPGVSIEMLLVRRSC